MTELSKTLIQSNNDFNTNLFENLEGASNLISAHGIILTLGLLQLASNGQTDTELRKFLGRKYDLSDIQSLLGLFNNSHVKTDLIFIINKSGSPLHSYLELISKVSTVILTSYRDVKKLSLDINRFITRETDAMIKNTILETDFDLSPLLTLISTIYFKADWQYGFDPANTYTDKFHQSNLVQMMTQTNYFNYYEDSKIQLLELPYNNGKYAFGIVLPKKYLQADNIDYTINNVPQFSSKELNEFINNMEYIPVRVSIPKFTAKKRYDLLPILQKMNLKSVFNPEAQLDLISKSTFVTGIIQETVLIIDENGSVTTSVAGTARIDEEIAVFNADHAFLYYVRSIKSNIFLFYGDFQGH